MKPDAIPNLDAEIAVEFGRVRLPIESILNLQEGSLIETGRRYAGHDEEGPRTLLDIRLNGDMFAVGEAICIGEKWGVRVLAMAEND